MRVLIVCAATLIALLLSVSCDRDEPGTDAQQTPSATPAAKQVKGDATPDTGIADAVPDAAEVVEDVTKGEGDDIDASADKADAVDAADAAGDEPAVDEEPVVEDGVISVVFETTKGDITFELHPEWAPIGVEHFLELVNAGFYDGAPWFRVLPGFVAQCGVAEKRTRLGRILEIVYGSFSR